MHLGNLESSQGAGFFLGFAPSKSYASLVLSKLPVCKLPDICMFRMKKKCVRCFQGASDISITASFDLANRFI